MNKTIHNLKIKNANIVEAVPHHLFGGERHTDLYYYDVRHSDSDNIDPCTIEHGVWVNYCATIGLDKPLSFNGESYIELNKPEKQIIVTALSN